MAAPRRSAKADAAHGEPEPTENPDVEEQNAQPAAESAGPTAMERAYMDALKRERAGYEQRGLKDRVAQVNAELKRLGTRGD